MAVSHCWTIGAGCSQGAKGQVVSLGVLSFPVSFRVRPTNLAICSDSVSREAGGGVLGKALMGKNHPLQICVHGSPGQAAMSSH